MRCTGMWTFSGTRLAKGGQLLSTRVSNAHPSRLENVQSAYFVAPGRSLAKPAAEAREVDTPAYRPGRAPTVSFPPLYSIDAQQPKPLNSAA